MKAARLLPRPHTTTTTTPTISSSSSPSSSLTLTSTLLPRRHLSTSRPLYPRPRSLVTPVQELQYQTLYSCSYSYSSAPGSLSQSPCRTRLFSTQACGLRGILPESSNPAAPKPEAHATSGSAAAHLSEAEYHEIADQYLDSLVYAAEELSEKNEEGWDVEFSAGVLTIAHADRGSWVINKQPPNKQIWLSSPESGPKRYDWVIPGAGQHEKEGSTVDPGDDGVGGKWIYLRDGSGLSDLLKREIGVVVSREDEADDATGS